MRGGSGLHNHRARPAIRPGVVLFKGDFAFHRDQALAGDAPVACAQRPVYPLWGARRIVEIGVVVLEICQNVVDGGIGGRTLISVVYGFKGMGLLRLSASPRGVR